MKIFKAKVAAGDGIYNVDAIEYQGKLWLVPHWLDNLATGETTPTRIVRFDNLEYKDVRGSSLGDFVLTRPIPKALLDVETPKQSIAGFEYIELPAVKKPPDAKTH
jgi:hypothetical protein